MDNQTQQNQEYLRQQQAQQAQMIQMQQEYQRQYQRGIYLQNIGVAIDSIDPLLIVQTLVRYPVNLCALTPQEQQYLSYHLGFVLFGDGVLPDKNTAEDYQALGTILISAQSRTQMENMNSMMGMNGMNYGYGMMQQPMMGMNGMMPMNNGMMMQQPMMGGMNMGMGMPMMQQPMYGMQQPMMMNGMGMNYGYGMMQQPMMGMNGMMPNQQQPQLSEEEKQKVKKNDPEVLKNIKMQVQGYFNMCNPMIVLQFLQANNIELESTENFEYILRTILKQLVMRMDEGSVNIVYSVVAYLYNQNQAAIINKQNGGKNGQQVQQPMMGMPGMTMPMMGMNGMMPMNNGMMMQQPMMGGMNMGMGMPMMQQPMMMPGMQMQMGVSQPIMPAGGMMQQPRQGNSTLTGAY